MILDLDNIKLVFFDFDNTLAIHKDKEYLKHRGESEEKCIEYFKNAYLFPWNFYTEIEPCKPNPVLQNLVSMCIDKKIKMFCLTGMRFSLHKYAKEFFVKQFYGNRIEVVSAYPQKNKVSVVKIMQDIYGVQPQEILVIDDDKDVLELMKQENFVSMLPEEIR